MMFASSCLSVHQHSSTTTCCIWKDVLYMIYTSHKKRRLSDSENSAPSHHRQLNLNIFMHLFVFIFKFIYLFISAFIQLCDVLIGSYFSQKCGG